MNIEATYLLQKAEKDELYQWTIKQSLSRGISWLAKYPVEECSVLQDIVLHFTCAPYKNVQKDPRNEYVKERVDVVEEKIKSINPEYNTLHVCLEDF